MESAPNPEGQSAPLQKPRFLALFTKGGRQVWTNNRGQYDWGRFSHEVLEFTDKVNSKNAQKRLARAEKQIGEPCEWRPRLS